MKNFLPADFFDYSDFGFKDIFVNINFVWEVLSKLSDFIALKLKGEFKPNHKNNVFVGEGTVIEEGVMIKGPAIIGRNCFIAHGAYIRENVILGDNVTIGHASEIKNSIILNNTSIAHFNYVGDSIIGKNVNFGGGALIANFRLDGETVKVRLDGKRIDTKLIKFGAIVGDGAKIGAGAVLNPGTLLGKNCVVYPLVSVFGTHQEKEIIK